MYPSIPSLLDQVRQMDQTGDMPAAFRLVRQALQLARQSGDPRDLADCLATEALLHFRLGHYAEATNRCHQVLHLSSEASPARAEALLLLGSCASETYSLSQAEHYFHQAADLAREIDYPRARARALHNLAVGVYLPRGRFDLALTSDQEALAIARQHSLSDYYQLPLISLAMGSQLSNHYQAARDYLDQLAQAAPPRSLAYGYYLCLEGSQSQQEEENELALEYYRRALSIADAIGEPGLNIDCRLGLSHTLLVGEQAPAAYAWADEAVAIAVRVNYQHLQGCALIERGRCAWQIGNLTEAQADLQQASNLLDELQASYDLARAVLLLATLAHQQPPSHPEGKDRPLNDRAAQLLHRWIRLVSENGYFFLLDQERSLALPLISAGLKSGDPGLSAECAALVNQLQRYPAPPLRLAMLGDFQVWCGGRHVEARALRRRRAGELLALLALTPAHSLSTAQVQEALWPENEPDAGCKEHSVQVQLHHATSALRRALEPDLPEKFPSRYLQVEEGRVTLNLPPGYWIDVEVFELLLQAKDNQAALALYRGDLLPEYLYEEWSIPARQRLIYLYQQALWGTANEQFACQQYTDCLETCRALLASEPWHEEATLLGMQACVKIGNLPAALRLYQVIEQRLKTDLDTTPQEDLNAFYRSLLRRS